MSTNSHWSVVVVGVVVGVGAATAFVVVVLVVVVGQHDHPSLQSRLIISETVQLLDLRKACMFHFFICHPVGAASSQSHCSSSSCCGRSCRKMVVVID